MARTFIFDGYKYRQKMFSTIFILPIDKWKKGYSNISLSVGNEIHIQERGNQMFILQSQATIEKAIERAKAVHPKVHVKTFGEYEVSGSCGSTYTVRCERRNNLKTVDCDCVAGQYGTPCFHAAAAVAQHSYLAAQAITF